MMVLVNTLPQPERLRLAKLLGLLGSDLAGERDAAALAAHRSLQRHGLTWTQLLELEPAEPAGPDWRSICEELLRWPNALRTWERRFVSDLSKFPRASSKQCRVLNEIAERVLGRQNA